MKTCLIVNPSTDQYCGLPADRSWEGKLPACRLCLLEIRLDIFEDVLERTIERHLREIDERLEWLAAHTGHPVTAKKWRNELDIFEDVLERTIERHLRKIDERLEWLAARDGQ